MGARERAERQRSADAAGRVQRTGDLMADLAASLEARRPVHWIGDAPTSLHGNGAGSFARETRDVAEVTCRLCITLLSREGSGS